MPNYIFWQSFEEKKLTLRTDSFLTDCVLTRDEDYSIRIVLSGVIPETPMPLLENNLGKFFGASQPLIATDRDTPGMREYRITNYFFENQVTRGGRNITLTGYALDVEEYFEERTAAGSPEFVMYWLLNSNSNLDYSRSLEANGTQQESVKFGDFATDTYNFLLPDRKSWNLFHLDYQGHKLVFGRVVEEFVKVKASFVRFERGYFPDEKEIYELTLVLSYLFGTAFENIGHTIYNAASSPIANTYDSTLRKNLDALFSQAHLPPIPIRIGESRQVGTNPELLINEFIAAFNAKKEELSLTKVLWHINYAASQDIYLMMQPLSTAFDIICNSYLSANKKTTILEPAKFAAFVEKVDELLKQTYGQSAETSKLLGNIRGTNQIGTGQRHSIVLEDLRLELSQAEKDALRERNIVIHGSPKEENISRRVFLTRVFYTLLNRVVLSLLTPRIPYVDYSMKGKRVASLEKAQEGSPESNP